MNMSPIRWRDTLDMPALKNEHGNGKRHWRMFDYRTFYWLNFKHNDVNANYQVFMVGNRISSLFPKLARSLPKFVCIQIHKFFIIYFTYIHLNNYLLFLSLLIVLRSMKTIDPHARANASIYWREKKKKIEREREGGDEKKVLSTNNNSSKKEFLREFSIWQGYSFDFSNE